MQKKDSNQRRHLPGWCGPGRLSWRAPWGPGFSSQSPQHRFPPIAHLPMFLSWTVPSGFQSWFPVCVGCSIGVITKETISSWWRHQNFPTRLLKHGNGNADDPQRDESKHSYQISGLYSNLVGLAIPPRRLTRTYPGWLQAAGKGWLGIRNKKTLQPYESGK